MARGFVDNAMYMRPFDLDSARAQMESISKAAEMKLTEMLDFRAQLWGELMGDKKLQSHCGPWEVRLHINEQMSLSKCLLGSKNAPEPDFVRALRRLDHANPFFLAPIRVDECVAKLRIMIRPGVSYLSGHYKRMLVEIWNTIAKWSIYLLLGTNITLLNFVDNMPDQKKCGEEAQQIINLCKERQGLRDRQKAINEDKVLVEDQISAVEEELETLASGIALLINKRGIVESRIADLEAQRDALVGHMEVVNGSLEQQRTILTQNMRCLSMYCRQRNIAKDTLKETKLRVKELSREERKVNRMMVATGKKRKKILEDLADRGVVERTRIKDSASEEQE